MESVPSSGTRTRAPISTTLASATPRLDSALNPLKHSRSRHSRLGRARSTRHGIFSERVETKAPAVAVAVAVASAASEDRPSPAKRLGSRLLARGQSISTRVTPLAPTISFRRLCDWDHVL